MYYKEYIPDFMYQNLQTVFLSNFKKYREPNRIHPKLQDK